MEFRQIGNVLWAIGKLKLRLSEEELGPYLVQELEDRILHKLDSGGLDDPRTAEQLWYGLAQSGCDWKQELLGLLMDLTIRDLAAWGDCKSAAQACLSIATFTSQSVLEPNEQHKEQLAAVITHFVTSDLGDELCKSLTAFINTSALMGIPLEPRTIKLMHDNALHMPLHLARQQGRLNLARSLRSFGSDLRYQPSAEEVALWYQRLVHDIDEAWTPDILSRVAAAFATCKNMPPPPPEFLTRVVKAAEGLPQDSTSRLASRLYFALQRWGVALPPDVAVHFAKRGVASGAK